MTEKIQVKIEDILTAQQLRSLVNSHDLSVLEFTENGKIIEIPQRYMDRFKITGLSNWDFICMEVYKNGMPKSETLCGCFTCGKVIDCECK